MIPLVSIIVPAYNASPWIEATLACALAQSHPACEILVIDDGSADDTVSRVGMIAAQHPERIRIETQLNAGASAARNHALRLARGDFIQFLDADDLLSPRKIELQLALLATHPANMLATCRWGRFEDDPTAARFVDAQVWRDFEPLDWMALHCGTASMMHPAAWLVPRTVIDAAGPWNESLSLNDDGEYFARIVLASAGLAFCDDDEAVTYYRSGIVTSLSQRRSPRAINSLRRSIELVSAHVTSFASDRGEPIADPSSPLSIALGNYWQRLAYDLYPDDPAGSRAALDQVRRLGGSALRPELGGRLQVVARLLGWRVAYRLRHWLNR